MNRFTNFLARLKARICPHPARKICVIRPQSVKREDDHEIVTYHMRCLQCGALFNHHHAENPDDRLTAAIIRAFDEERTHTLH